MENLITESNLNKLGIKVWVKPGTNDRRFYINPNKVLDLAYDNEVTVRMSNAERNVFEENSWWYTADMNLKTSLSFKATKHKYLMTSVPELIESLIKAVTK